jgi:hypothetical protein
MFFRRLTGHVAESEWQMKRGKSFLILALGLLATPAQANPLTLICTGKTLQQGGETDMNPATAVLDLDKLTFKPPWTGTTYPILSVKETEFWFSVDDEMITSNGTLDRVTGHLRYVTTFQPNKFFTPGPLDNWSSVGVCKPSKPLF